MLFWTICIFLGLLYFGLAFVAYVSGIDPLLFTLSLPWSMVISLLSNLIIHMSVKGVDYINVGMLLGTIVNMLVFWWVCYLVRLRRNRSRTSQIGT